MQGLTSLTSIEKDVPGFMLSGAERTVGLFKVKAQSTADNVTKVLWKVRAPLKIF